MSFDTLKNLDARQYDFSRIGRILWGLICARHLDRARWERFYIMASRRIIVDGTFEDSIPPAFRRPGVVYRFNVPAYKERVMVQDLGFRLLLYCHLSHAPALCDLMIEVLKENGVPAYRSRNDIMINGKKASAVLSMRRGEFFAETAIVNNLYTDAVFKELLPPRFYRAGYPAGETGISGILNECPGADIERVIKEVCERATSYTPAGELEDQGIEFPFATIGKEEYRSILAKQLQELKRRGRASLHQLEIELEELGLGNFWGGENDE